MPASGFHRIRGVAGAGKSFVLSHRAAHASQDGKNVLVLSFNITMSHVLRDLLKRAPYIINWGKLTWGHFHGWAMKQCVDAGYNLSETDDHHDQVNDMLLESLDKITNDDQTARSYRKPVYDAIYIDEGQDFEPRWLDILACFLADGGELVLFADHKQNLYAKDGGRDQHQTMRRCHFRGVWAQLPGKTHRLPWRIAMFLNEFALWSKIGDDDDLPMLDYAERAVQAELNLDVMAWRNVNTIDQAIDVVDDALTCLGNPNPGDVVVLVPSHKLGMKCVERLGKKYQQIVHIFAEAGANSPESRRRKLAFWMGRGGLKMCTIHSFKGWEISNVVMIWPPQICMQDIGLDQYHSLFYTGVSRAMANLVVINANRNYDVLAKDWDAM